MLVACQVREGSSIYFSGPWNLVDVSASVSLLAGGVGHFTAHMSSVRTIGALGVTLKWLGFVDYLRCFEKTGSLVRIVLVRRSTITIQPVGNRVRLCVVRAR